MSGNSTPTPGIVTANSGSPIPTFRDPAGSLVFEADRVVRHIHPASRPEIERFLASGFYRRMVESGLMVPSTIDASPDGLRLFHPRLPVPSYPWEWTPAQWLAAAELTLDVCQQGLAEGWVLKDATPLNVLFVGSQPVFVDVLSFERHEPGTSIWLAYGQYVRTFLLPLLMRRLLRWPLELSFFKRDGYEPSEMYAALGWMQRLSPAALWPITLPALLDRRKSAAATPSSAVAKQRDPELSLELLQRTLKGLRKRTRSAVGPQAASEWAQYTDTLTHYTAAEAEQKRAWVRGVLEELAPQRVLDVGANTGEYSALAAEVGAEVLALERDAEAADRIVRMSRTKRLNIQTIHADLARPTPAAGWGNAESSALLPRLEGRFELVLLLAVVHHLLLLEQIPLPAIMALCHRLTARYLILEWVPATDPMFVSLMRGRDELYGTLRESDLLAACAPHFRTLRRQALANGRILFLFEKM